MPLTNNELEHALHRARTEPILLPRLDRGGASSVGDALLWDGERWSPGPIPDDSLDGAITDTDGEPILDCDGTPVDEGGDGASFQLNLVEWLQSTPLQVWLVLHAFGRRPINVQVEDLDGREMHPTVSFPSLDTVRIQWGFPMTGRAKILFS